MLVEEENMGKIVIYVWGGMVQSVFADHADVNVEVIDLDTDEGYEKEDEMRNNQQIPPHHVW